MAKPKHTPTPWEVDDGQNSVLAGTWALRHGRTIIGYIESWDTGSKADMDEAETNAAFIVKACNIHDPLVFALEALLDCSNEKDQTAFNMRYDTACAKARDILARVWIQP